MKAMKLRDKIKFWLKTSGSVAKKMTVKSPDDFVLSVQTVDLEGVLISGLPSSSSSSSSFSLQWSSHAFNRNYITLICVLWCWWQLPVTVSSLPLWLSWPWCGFTVKGFFPSEWLEAVLTECSSSSSMLNLSPPFWLCADKWSFSACVCVC